MNTSPTTEERIWAVLSHLSVLAFGMGMLLPIIGWSEQRRKSKYASFQCLQALGYQSLGYTVWLLSYLFGFIGIIIFVIVMSFRAEQNGQAFDPTAGPAMALVYIVIFGSLGLYMLLPLLAAIACGFGREFRYPVLGNRLAKYLGYEKATEAEQLLEEHEDRWVAAMGHFSVIVLLWGLLAPVTAWIVQGKRSAFQRFQSIQTTVYQVFVNLLFLLVGFLYFFGVIVFFSMTGLEGSPDLSSPTGMPGLVIFGIASLCASIIMLIAPLFHILGQWAGYRVLKGDNYHYPLIGKMVERQIAGQTRVSAENDLNPKGEVQ
jgi:uncharacterized Tic20 family protein